MTKVSRRTFVSNSIAAAAAFTLPATAVSAAASNSPAMPAQDQNAPDIVDTNVHLFDWPFRKLKYGTTEALVAKLRKHRITQAWAGNYEALFHKDISGVNARLAKECQANGEGMLIPFGTVNLAWPDWAEDLRRCQEEYNMPGIRIYPVYQTFDLSHPDFEAFVKEVARRKMILQIVGDMEDSRHHHPIVEIRNLSLDPLPGILKRNPDAKVELVYWNHRVPAALLKQLVEDTNVYFDTSRIEGAGEVGRFVEGKSWTGSKTAIPANRILFGSHAPYFPVETNIYKMFEAPMSLEQITSIMNDNARQFLKTV